MWHSNSFMAFVFMGCQFNIWKSPVSVCFYESLAPWKKSYDKPRQHIKKQRHYFANKGSHCQSYGFSSSHVQSWRVRKAER